MDENKKIEKYLVIEAAKPKWGSDPYKFKYELSKRVKKVADDIEEMWISEDRYYPGFEQNKKHYASVNKALQMYEMAVAKLEAISAKAQKGL